MNKKLMETEECEHPDCEAEVSAYGNYFEVEMQCDACGGENSGTVYYGESFEFSLYDCAEVCVECQQKEDECGCHICAKCGEQGTDVEKTVCYHCEHNHEDEECLCDYCSDERESQPPTQEEVPLQHGSAQMTITLNDGEIKVFNIAGEQLYQGVAHKGVWASIWEAIRGE